MPSISTLGRQRQLDLCEFKVSLVHRASFRTAKTTQTLSQIHICVYIHICVLHDTMIIKFFTDNWSAC